MTNFLEELYYGNIDPQARGYRKGSHNLKVSKSINELEEKLTERLSGEDKALFLDFCNAYGELMGESGLDSFLVGFRLVIIPGFFEPPVRILRAAIPENESHAFR